MYGFFYDSNCKNDLLVYLSKQLIMLFPLSIIAAYESQDVNSPLITYNTYL